MKGLLGLTLVTLLYLALVVAYSFLWWGLTLIF